MSKVICTGGAGFVVSHCVDLLISQGHEVLVIDNLQGGYRENLNPQATFIHADICNQHVVHEAFEAFQPDYVIHGAAFASENCSNWCPAYTANNICVGTSNIIAAAVNTGVKCLVNLSSIAVYGVQQPPFTEETPVMPMDAYGAAKAYTESLCGAAHHTHGLNYVTFRPHNVIGTRQNLADKTRNVASIFIRQMLEDRPLTVYSDGSQTRAFSPIANIAPIIVGSLENEKSWNQTYNIGGDKAYSVMDLARIVLDPEPNPHNRINYLPERKEAKHAHSDHSKAKKMFGVYDVSTVEETIEDMIHEAQKQTMNPIQELPPIEINKNLPEIWK